MAQDAGVHLRAGQPGLGRRGGQPVRRPGRGLVPGSHGGPRRRRDWSCRIWPSWSTDLGQLFTAGPPVVRGGTGEDLTKEELGGADVHRRNGTVERFAGTEDAAFALVRALPVLPAGQRARAAAGAGRATTRRTAGRRRWPRRSRAARARPTGSGRSWTRSSTAARCSRYAEYGGATVTALARLDGHPVGVIATDPFRGTTMSVEGALAVTRLVDLCETFHLPIVSLTDQGGLTIGRVAEERGTIRHGARAIAAVYQARVPQAELIVRRVYGVGGAGIVNRHRAGRSWAWPSGDWGSLPVQGGVEAAFRAQLRAGRGPGGRDRADPPGAGRGQLAVPYRGTFRRAGPDRSPGLQAAAVRLGPGRLPGPARADRPPRPSAPAPNPSLARPPVRPPGPASRPGGAGGDDHGELAAGAWRAQSETAPRSLASLITDDFPRRREIVRDHGCGVGGATKTP